MEPHDKKLLAGAVLLLGFIFGVPAVLVPVTMSNVPERSKFKVLSGFENAVQVVERSFRDHADPTRVSGRVEALPVNSRAWITRLNPTGRQAPGGGPMYLPESSARTGAIGIIGNTHRVSISQPAYAGLDAIETTVSLSDFIVPSPSAPGSRTADR